MEKNHTGKKQKKLQLCKDLEDLQQELNNLQKKFSAMLKEWDWLGEKLESVSKKLTLEQFKLFANDSALKDLHIKLQTKRSKRIKLLSSLDEATK